MTIKLTQGLVDRVTREKNGEAFYDEEVPGLVLKVGKRSSSYRYKGSVNDGRSTPLTLTIGRADCISLKEARNEARALKVRLSRGEDPRDEKKRKREVPTVEAYMEHYLENRPNLSPRTRVYYGNCLERMGRLARMPMDRITRQDVRSHFERVSRTATYGANAMYRTGRALWADYLRSDELPEGNVWARAIRPNKETPRDWALGDDAFRALWRAVDAMENRVRATAWITLALTGLRLSEALSLRWESVDLDAGTAWIASPKGGRDRAFTRALPKALCSELHSIREAAPWSPFLFPANSKSGHIPHLRTGDTGFPPPHALRHSWATRALDLGVEMSTISLCLNHSQLGKTTTSRYVSRDKVTKPVIEATEMVAEHLLSFRD